ncbi:hypothetical protein MMC34_000219 [Xylographa carneopallida]|nr:hypothetical protein [Xylographa carneopallida]
MSTSALFANVAANIAAIRTRLFLVEEEVVMPLEQWDEVWPYVDNIWVKNKTRPSKDGSTIKYFLCRKHASKGYVSKVKPGSEKRRRLARDAIGCGMRIKTVTTAFSDTASRTGEWQAHCHELELLDYEKKNSGIKTLAAQEASRGYKISLVADAITAERAVLKDIGGHWLTLADVHNSAAAYKTAHPDACVRGAHTPRKEQNGPALQTQDDDETSGESVSPACQPTAKEQWLAKKAAEWDKREEKRRQKTEVLQLRERLLLPPKVSPKRKRRAPGVNNGMWLPSGDDENGVADAPFDWDVAA